MLSTTATYDTRARLVVRVDGDHGRRGSCRGEHRRRRPVRHAGRREGRAHPRAPRRERQPRRRRRTRRTTSTSPSCRRAPAPATSCRSRTSCTPAATCRWPTSVPTVKAGGSDHVRQQHRRAARATASGTRSPRARRRATGRPASPTRSPTATRCSTPGELGDGRAADRRAGSRGRRPSDLPDGTYTYFCRIHPFMRGAFRVDG